MWCKFKGPNVQWVSEFKYHICMDMYYLQCILKHCCRDAVLDVCMLVEYNIDWQHVMIRLFLWACFRNLMSSCRCCCPYSVDSRKQNGSLHNLRVTRIVSYHLSCWCTVYVVKHFMLAIEKRKHILCKCNWLRLRASQASNRQFCSVMEFYLLNRLTIDTVCILLNAWKY